MVASPTDMSNGPFSNASRLSIADLSPSLRLPTAHFVETDVVVVWPYSSSTKTFSLLLAEIDIRRRKYKGQVKATFQGPSAEAVAKTDVGIGDRLKLGLHGVEWAETGENVRTPGKKIQWDLLFGHAVLVEILRDSQQLAVLDIKHVSGALHDDATGPNELKPQYLNGVRTAALDSNIAWESPAFVKRARLSAGSFIDASLDPFADDDGFVLGKGRKRTKFARDSGTWRFVDRSPSPDRNGYTQGTGLVQDVRSDISSVSLSTSCTSSNDERCTKNQVGQETRGAALDYVGVPTQAGTASENTNMEPVIQEGKRRVSREGAATEQVRNATAATPQQYAELRTTASTHESEDEAVEITHRTPSTQAHIGDMPSDENPHQPTTITNPITTAPKTNETGAQNCVSNEPSHAANMPSIQAPKVLSRDMPNSLIHVASDSDEVGIQDQNYHDLNAGTPRMQPLLSVSLATVSSSLRRADTAVASFPDCPDHGSELDSSSDPHEVQTISERAAKKEQLYEHATSTNSVAGGDVNVVGGEHKHYRQLDAGTLRQGPSNIHGRRSQVDELINGQLAGGPSRQSGSMEDQPNQYIRRELSPMSPSEVRASEFAFLNTNPIDIHQRNESEMNVTHVYDSEVRADAIRGAGLTRSVSRQTSQSSSIGRQGTEAEQYVGAEPCGDVMERTCDHVEDPLFMVEKGAEHSPVDIVVHSAGYSMQPKDVPIDPKLVEANQAMLESEQANDQTRAPPQTSPPTFTIVNGGETLDVSATEYVRKERLSTSPIPFQQHRHGGTSTKPLRRSSMPNLFDGTSDEAYSPEDSNVTSTFSGLHESSSTHGYDDNQEGNVEMNGPQDESSSSSIAEIQQTEYVEEGANRKIEVELTVEHAIGEAPGYPRPESPSDLTQTMPETSNHEICDKPWPWPSSTSFLNEAGDGVHNPLLMPTAELSVAPLLSESTGKADHKQERSFVGREQSDSEARTHGLAAEDVDPAAQGPEPPLTGERASCLAVEVLQQLATPDNTQPESDTLQTGAFSHQILSHESHEESLPTPQSTQSARDLSETTEALEINNVIEMKRTGEVSSPMASVTEHPPRCQPSSPPSRRISLLQDNPQALSPYFTPRRSSQPPRPTESSLPPTETVVSILNNEPASSQPSLSRQARAGLPSSVVASRPHTPGSSVTGLPTPLSYYATLSSLPEHFSQSVDVLAICTTLRSEPQRSQSGPRDWHTTLRLTDPSMTGKLTVTAQFFRPYKYVLPYARAGDVILIRAMKVQSQKRKCMLLSTESSAWATFTTPEKFSEHALAPQLEVKVSGPPIEYGAEEERYVNVLKSWWHTEGRERHTLKEDSESQKQAIAGQGDPHLLADIEQEGAYVQQVHDLLAHGSPSYEHGISPIGTTLGSNQCNDAQGSEALQMTGDQLDEDKITIETREMFSADFTDDTQSTVASTDSSSDVEDGRLAITENHEAILRGGTSRRRGNRTDHAGNGEDVLLIDHDAQSTSSTADLAQPPGNHGPTIYAEADEESAGDEYESAASGSSDPGQDDDLGARVGTDRDGYSMVNEHVSAQFIAVDFTQECQYSAENETSEAEYRIAYEHDRPDSSALNSDQVTNRASEVDAYDDDFMESKEHQHTLSATESPIQSTDNDMDENTADNEGAMLDEDEAETFNAVDHTGDSDSGTDGRPEDEGEGSDSDTNIALSSQIFHELGNGSQHTDPTPSSRALGARRERTPTAEGDVLYGLEDISEMPGDGGILARTDNTEIGEQHEAEETRRRGTRSKGRPSGTRNEGHLVHELRDGFRYVDEGSPRTLGGRGERKSRRSSVIHELRDGYRYTDG